MSTWHYISVSFLCLASLAIPICTAGEHNRTLSWPDGTTYRGMFDNDSLAAGVNDAETATAESETDSDGNQDATVDAMTNKRSSMFSTSGLQPRYLRMLSNISPFIRQIYSRETINPSRSGRLTARRALSRLPIPRSILPMRPLPQRAQVLWM